MIFDTSSIYKAIEMNYIEKLQGEKTLDLSLYELGNVVWKSVNRKIISKEEGDKILNIIMKVVSLMEIVKIGLNAGVYKIAIENGISYYDAAFIHAAITSKEAIVSEDRKLLDVAKNYQIKSSSIEELP